MYRLRAFVLAILVGLISIGPARGQDWAGAYAGIHAGYRWGSADLTRPAYSFPDGLGGTILSPASIEHFKTSGPIGGGHLGYNFLPFTGWLIGIEADITAGRDKDTTGAQSTTTVVDVEREQFLTLVQNRTSSFELGPQGTLRARLGLINGPWLFYATGGVAFTQVDWTDTISIVGGPSASVGKSDTLTGWVVGAGLETFAAPGWLIRTEYLYEDFGSMKVPLAFTQQTGNLDVTAHKLRFGVSVKF